jgi:hypothetical protein
VRARGDGAAGAVGENRLAVGDAELELLREAGEGGAQQRIRRDGGGDDAAKGIAPLAGRARRQAAVEDGREGVDAEAAVLEPDRRRQPRLRVRAGDPQCLAERGVGAEVDRVGGRRRRLPVQQRVDEPGVGAGGDADLLAGLDVPALGGRQPRRPADGDDLRPRERHARVRREALGRRVVPRTHALEGEDRGARALLERRGRAPRTFVRLAADVVLLQPPERERQQAGRQGADEQGSRKTEPGRHPSCDRPAPTGVEGRLRPLRIRAG